MLVLSTVFISKASRRSKDALLTGHHSLTISCHSGSWLISIPRMNTRLSPRHAPLQATANQHCPSARLREAGLRLTSAPRGLVFGCVRHISVVTSEQRADASDFMTTVQEPNTARDKGEDRINVISVTSSSRHPPVLLHAKGYKCSAVEADPGRAAACLYGSRTDNMPGKEGVSSLTTW